MPSCALVVCMCVGRRGGPRGASLNVGIVKSDAFNDATDAVQGVWPTAGHARPELLGC